MNGRVKKLPEAHEAVRAQWLSRVEAEYRSAVLTQTLTLWMMQAGLSPDLLHEGLRIADDELVHADLSMAVYRAAGGADVPKLARESLVHPTPDAASLERAIVAVTVDSFCLGETVAVPLFKNLREGCTVPVARRALDRILRDEVRHRAFGWTTLAYLFEGPHGDALRAFVGRELAGWFRRIRRSYAPAFAEDAREVDAVSCAWGLMAPARYAAVVARTWERDWRPRFAKVGVDASGAWAESASG